MRRDARPARHHASGSRIAASEASAGGARPRATYRRDGARRTRAGRSRSSRSRRQARRSAAAPSGRRQRSRPAARCADRGPMEAQHVLGERRRVRQPERLDEPGQDRVVPDGVGDNLDDPTEDEYPVLQYDMSPERMHLRQLGAALDIGRERVVAAAGVGEVVAVDPARVRQQVTDRDHRRHVPVGDAEVRQVRRTGASSSTRPSSTSCMTSVAVQTFVIEPIWNSESVVASTPVSRLSVPEAAAATSPSRSTGDGCARHVVHLAEVVEAFLERRAIDRERHRVPPWSRQARRRSGTRRDGAGRRRRRTGRPRCRPVGSVSTTGPTGQRGWKWQPDGGSCGSGGSPSSMPSSPSPPAPAAGRRRAACRRVRVLRVRDDVVGRPDLHDAPQVHHREHVAHVADGRQVVRDEHHRVPEPLLQVAHQVEHGALHRDVERRGDLVRDEHLRPARERPCDRDALPLAAGETARRLAGEVGVEVDEVEVLADRRGAAARP